MFLLSFACKCCAKLSSAAHRMSSLCAGVHIIIFQSSRWGKSNANNSTLSYLPRSIGRMLLTHERRSAYAHYMHIYGNPIVAADLLVMFALGIVVGHIYKCVFAFISKRPGFIHGGSLYVSVRWYQNNTLLAGRIQTHETSARQNAHRVCGICETNTEHWNLYILQI